MKWPVSSNTVRILAGTVMLSVFSGMPAAHAHHSYAAFDMSKTMTLEGTVSKWEWTNPHTFLYLEVQAKDGSTEHWEFEYVSPAMGARGGFSRKTFTPGDKIKVTFAPNRDPSLKVGSFQYAILANGTQVGQARPSGFGAGGPGGPGGPGAGPGAGEDARRPGGDAP